MDDWQKNIIRDNLTYLIDKINCNTALLAKLIQRKGLGKYDKEDLELLRWTPTDKSDRLLTYVQQKLNGFDILIGALSDEGQFAPARCLLEHRFSYYSARGEQQPPVAHLTVEVIQELQAGGVPANIIPPPFVPAALGAPLETVHADKQLKDIIREGEKLTVSVKQPSGYPKRTRYAFILNIVEYKAKDGRRKGAFNDTYYMTELCKGLGFQIFPTDEDFRMKESKSEDEIRNELKEFKVRCITDKVDCFVIFFGSFGFTDRIVTSDLKVLKVYDDIIYQFQDPIKELVNGVEKEKEVAKIFIIQACQNPPPDWILKEEKMNQNQQAQTLPGEEMKRTKHSLYWKAQLTNYKAGRDNVCGSYFVLVLTYVLMKMAHNTSLSAMIDEVQKLLPELSEYTGDEVHQLPPSTKLGLADDFHFFK